MTHNEHNMLQTRVFLNLFEVLDFNVWIMLDHFGLMLCHFGTCFTIAHGLCAAYVQLKCAHMWM